MDKQALHKKLEAEIEQHKQKALVAVDKTRFTQQVNMANRKLKMLKAVERGLPTANAALEVALNAQERFNPPLPDFSQNKKESA